MIQQLIEFKSRSNKIKMDLAAEIAAETFFLARTTPWQSLASLSEHVFDRSIRKIAEYHVLINRELYSNSKEAENQLISFITKLSI